MTAQNIVVRAQKETGIAYVLWLLLGTLGVHRFYLNRSATALVQAGLSLVGWATAILLVGFVLLVPLWIWVIVDGFLIPGMVRNANAGL